MRTAVVAVLLAVGVAVSLSAAVGIVRMPDVYLRIQASAKMVVAAAIPVLIAVVVAKGAYTPYGSRALIIAVLLMIMNPIAAHVLTRASYKAGVPMWRGATIDQPGERRATSAAEHVAHADRPPNRARDNTSGDGG